MVHSLRFGVKPTIVLSILFLIVLIYHLFLSALFEPSSFDYPLSFLLILYLFPLQRAHISKISCLTSDSFVEPEHFMKILVQDDYFRLFLSCRLEDMTGNRMIVAISEQIDVVDVSVEV